MADIWRRRLLTIGPILPDGYEQPRGDCAECGGQCDGEECGLHAAGCIFGGPEGGTYWLYADECPHDHGPDLPA